MDSLTPNGQIMRGSARMTLTQLLAEVESANAKGSVVQIFDPQKTINALHLNAAYAHMRLSFKNRTNTSGKPNVEMLLFAAMTRQIGAAIRLIGAKDSSDFIVFASDTKALRKFKSIKLSQFRENGRHTAKAAAAFGIKAKGKRQLGMKLLGKMAGASMGY